MAKKVNTPTSKTPAKVRTTVERSDNEVSAQTPAEDCQEILDQSESKLTDTSILIGDNEWDSALETLEEAIGDLVALRDAMLEAQQKGI